jgi:hypothetical protein
MSFGERPLAGERGTRPFEPTEQMPGVSGKLVSKLMALQRLEFQLPMDAHARLRDLFAGTWGVRPEDILPTEPLVPRRSTKTLWASRQDRKYHALLSHASLTNMGRINPKPNLVFDSPISWQSSRTLIRWYMTLQIVLSSNLTLAREHASGVLTMGFDFRKGSLPIMDRPTGLMKALALLPPIPYREPDPFIAAIWRSRSKSLLEHRARGTLERIRHQTELHRIAQEDMEKSGNFEVVGMVRGIPSVEVQASRHATLEAQRDYVKTTFGVFSSGRKRSGISHRMQMDSLVRSHVVIERATFSSLVKLTCSCIVMELAGTEKGMQWLVDTIMLWPSNGRSTSRLIRPPIEDLDRVKHFETIDVKHMGYILKEVCRMNGCTHVLSKLQTSAVNHGAITEDEKPAKVHQVLKAMLSSPNSAYLKNIFRCSCGIVGYNLCRRMSVSAIKSKRARDVILEFMRHNMEWWKARAVHKRQKIIAELDAVIAQKQELERLGDSSALMVMTRTTTALRHELLEKTFSLICYRSFEIKLVENGRKHREELALVSNSMSCAREYYHLVKDIDRITAALSPSEGDMPVLPAPVIKYIKEGNGTKVTRRLAAAKRRKLKKQGKRLSSAEEWRDKYVAPDREPLGDACNAMVLEFSKLAKFEFNFQAWISEGRFRSLYSRAMSDACELSVDASEMVRILSPEYEPEETHDDDFIVHTLEASVFTPEGRALLKADPESFAVKARHPREYDPELNADGTKRKITITNTVGPGHIKSRADGIEFEVVNPGESGRHKIKLPRGSSGMVQQPLVTFHDERTSATNPSPVRRRMSRMAVMAGVDDVNDINTELNVQKMVSNRRIVQFLQFCQKRYTAETGSSEGQGLFHAVLGFKLPTPTEMDLPAVATCPGLNYTEEEFEAKEYEIYVQLKKMITATLNRNRKGNPEGVFA